jgi:hypothetical protein
LAAYRADGEAIRRFFDAAGRRDDEPDTDRPMKRPVAVEV